MKLLAVIFALALAIVFGLQLASPIRERWEDNNRYQRQSESLDLARKQFDLDTYTTRQTATLPGKIAGDYGLLLLLGVGIAGGLWLVRDSYMQRRTPLVRQPGGYMVARHLIERGDPRLMDLMIKALEFEGAAAIARAEHQPGQQPASYSPHITVTREKAPELPSAPAQISDSAAGPLPGVTDLADVLKDFTPSKEAILLGLGAGGERLTVPLKAMMHCALLGATGTGKSNLLRCLLPQLQVAGARIVLSDPHYSDIDPETGEDWTLIRQNLYHPPAIRPGEIKALFEWLIEELDDRLDRRRNSQPIGKPIFWAFDELPILTSLVDDAPAHMGRIVREGRKVGVYALGCSQEWLVKVVGGSSGARDSFRTCFYLGGDRTSAAALLDVPARTIDDGPLGHGTALLRSVATPAARLVRVPLASNQGISRLLSGLSAGDARPIIEATAATLEPADRPEIGQKSPAAVGQQSAAVSLEATLAAEKFLRGIDPAEIVREMRNVNSKQGAKYQQALAEIHELIRQGIAGGAR